MKSIKKITNKVSNNFSAIAGSALLVGATLTGAAGMAAAQDGSSGDSMASMDLGEYPQPFVSEDGEVQTSIVLGSDAAVTDVVGATEIAGSLGAAAFGEESVSTEGGSFGWTASNGVTLDTSNDELYFGDSINDVRETLTEENLDILAETTFTDDNNDETDITNYLNVADLPVTFGNGADELDDEDPALHIDVPSEGAVDTDSYLFNLQANFGEGIDFSSSDVAGEEIELFGTEYTVADDNEDRSGLDDDELLLYGSQQDVDVDSGESTTITVNEEEVTLEVVSVNTGSTSSGETGNAAVRVDGTLESVSSGDTISVNNEEVRIDEIIKTGGSESSDGVVNFKIGSQELTLVDGEPIQDSDGDDIEGSHVEFNGAGDGTVDVNNNELSSIDLYVGAEDDDEDALTAGDTFSHSALPGVEVHFGGLNPNAAEEGDSTSEVAFDEADDDTAEISFTADSGDDATLGFVHDTDLTDDEQQNAQLADSDDDAIHTVEGSTVTEDEYIATDAGDFSHMWEVTSIDRDSEGDIAEGDQAEIELTDAVTGQSTTVELDAVDQDGNWGDGDEYYAGDEIIDGQKYYLTLEGDDVSDPEFRIAWGDGALVETGTSVSARGSNLDLGDEASAYTAVDTESQGAIAFTQDVSLPQAEDMGVSSDEFSVTEFTDTTTDSTTSGSNEITASLEGSGSATAGNVQVELQDSDGNTIVSGTVDSLAENGDLNNAASLDVISADGTVNGVQFTEATDNDELDFGPNVVDEVTRDLVLPSTESTDSKTTSISFDQIGSNDPTTSSNDVQVGQVTYDIGTDTVTSGELGVDATGAPAAVVMQPEDDDDSEHAYIVQPGVDDSDEEMSIGDESSITYTGRTNGGDGFNEANLDSDDEVYQSYSAYGTFSEREDDDQGSFTLSLPDGQSVVGAAVTGTDGSLETGGGSGSVNAASPTYQYADGLLTDDSDVGSARSNDNLVLVGGPAANSLTQELVDENQTMPASEYTSGQGMIQMVDGFSEGNQALVVAGATGEDTRTAAEFLADYRNNADSLEGNSEVTIETSSGSVVQ